MEDRWSALRNFASEAPTPQQVFYRWTDYLDRPINAEEYHRGREACVLWEDVSERWVVEGVTKKASKSPRRYFDTKQEAQAALEVEGYAHTRNVPVYERPRRRPAILGGVLAALGFVLLLAALLFLLVWIVKRVSELSGAP